MGRFSVSAFLGDEARLHVKENGLTIYLRTLQEHLDDYEAHLKAQDKAEPQSVPVCEKGVEQFAELIKHVLLCRSCRTFVGLMIESHGEQPAKSETTSA